MNFFKRIGRKFLHYANPKTHIKGARSALRHTREAHKRFFAFQKRVFSRENIKELGRDIASVKVKFMPYVTGVIAGVASYVFAPLGFAVAALGTGIGRWMGATAARGEGLSGHEAREEGRDVAKKTLTYGGLGAAAGVFTSAAVAALTAAPAAVPGAAAGGAMSGAEVGASMGTAVASVEGTGAAAGAAVGASAGAAAGATAAGGASLLETVWGYAKDIGGFALKIGPGIMQYLGGRGGSGGGETGAFPGGASAEGTGDGSTEGDFFDEVAGLPLSLKLAAGGIGAGLIYLALKKKGKAA